MVPVKERLELPSNLPHIELVGSIANHEFFSLADRSQEALRWWVGQELAITNQFSQELLAAASRIHEPAARAILVEIAADEHGLVEGSRIEGRSHPELLVALAASMNLGEPHTLPIEATDKYRQHMANRDVSLPFKLGELGVGGEATALIEYDRIRRSFEQAWPSARFQDFLDSNIDHDMEHVCLMLELSSMTEEGQLDFEAGALASVSQRIEYYDQLLALVLDSEL